MEMYIYENDYRFDCSIIPECKLSLCCVNLALSSLKFFERKDEFENRGFEFILNLSKKNLLNGENVQIGSCSILPLNYCTPFERNYCNIYFNFFSVDELTKFLARNEVITILKLSFGVDDFEVFFDESINYVIRPVESIKKKLILYNKCNDFKVDLIINVEWYARIPNKMIGKIKEPEKLEKCIPVSSYSQNKIFRTFLCNSPKIYLKLERAICNDPIISQSIMNLHPESEKLSVNTAYNSKSTNNNDRETIIQSLKIIGSWSLYIKDVILSEKGLNTLQDMFPIYRQSKSFRIIVKHCIKDKSDKMLTHVRSHWSIMNFFKLNNNSTSKLIPSNAYYIGRASIYSRIPEAITDKIDEKLFHINFLVPALQKPDEPKNDQGNPVFYGVLSPSEILLNQVSVVQLYSEFNKKDCLGYALISFSEIKEKPRTSINFRDKNNKIPQTEKEYSRKKPSITDYLDGISIIYLYIYWHIQIRAKNEKKTYENILFEFYSRISSSETTQGGVNVKGINKCINALIHSNNEITQNLKSYTSCIPEDIILFNSVYELKYYLQFPHLELFKKSSNEIFSNNLRVLNDFEFISKCNELGIRECISNTWREMINSSFVNISMKTYKMCIQKYKNENIFQI